ncbi:hypothetical protein BGZ98_000330 [Dissophora globulifera]|uniref:Nitrogen regulatory protein areA GATA-like domain-containing protein n=1 Tax=Dissophora globulifera TaxID=979702 RepID=A0A9P6UQP0_9FUNG|nr:hypothetical protein BGZ98_000330 [Dissophora globulifera]KAG0315381.1 hypothetical protein BGZ99_007493 [Dissophora globulifera]
MHKSSSAASSSAASPSKARTSIQREGPSAKTTPMHDDTDAGRLIPTVRPALAIDYLGNGWCNEDDIAASWKFMTKQKNDLINGLRLENASWRNWAKQRHHLKTVNPKTLNWLKDSDTTWLYGPLYKASIDEFDLARFGAQTIPGGTKIPASPTEQNGLKPALKHKTASELFKADTLFHVQSDLKLDRKIEPKSKAQESLFIKQHRQPKLRFNDSVEQCVSVDTDALSDDEVIDEDEEDAGILMRISAKRPARSIVRINPTRLKAGNMYGMESENALEESIYQDDDRFAGSETTYIKSRGEDEDVSDYGEDGAIAEDDYSRVPTSVDVRSWEAGVPESERLQAGKSGIGQRAVDIVNNVKDIVHWASSLVYNSSAF